MLVITGIVASLFAATSKFYVAKNCKDFAHNHKDTAILMAADRSSVEGVAIESFRQLPQKNMHH